MSAVERFDNFLITIVSETGGIEGLLNSMFSFLYRRTDFFYEMVPGDKMGFLPGEAEKMMVTIFKQYQKEYFKRVPQKDPKEVQKLLDEYNKKHRKEPEPKPQQPLSGPPVPENSKTEIKPAPKLSSEPAKARDEVMIEEKPKDVKQAVPKVSDISTYNGAKTEKYAWSQNITDVTVQIKLGCYTKSKDLDVTMDGHRIRVVRKATKEVIIEGEFYDAIRLEDSAWSIEEGVSLLLNLEKASENIWKTVIKGDDEIDATKVDNTKNLEDFDDETQGALRKIVHEQRQKAKGLPTSEEEKQMEMMKKAWDAEGSPFKGTPFDPSRLNFGNQGTGGPGGFV